MLTQTEFDFVCFDPMPFAPKGATLLRKSVWGDTIDWDFFVSEKETDTCVTRKIFRVRYFISTGEHYARGGTEKAQKFLCVNGPLAGKMVTEKKAEPYGYCSYNCAHNAYRTKGWARVVLVCGIFLTPNGMVKMA